MRKAPAPPGTDIGPGCLIDLIQRTLYLLQSNIWSALIERFLDLLRGSPHVQGGKRIAFQRLSSLAGSQRRQTNQRFLRVCQRPVFRNISALKALGDLPNLRVAVAGECLTPIPVLVILF